MINKESLRALVLIGLSWSLLLLAHWAFSQRQGSLAPLLEDSGEKVDAEFWRERQPTRLEPAAVAKRRRERLWRLKAIPDGKDQGPLRCRLGPWPPDHNKKTPDLQVELTNTSDSRVRWWYTLAPRDHVTFLLRDERAKVIKESFWGDLSSRLIFMDDTGRPVEPLPFVKELSGGETYTAGVYLSSLAEAPPPIYREAQFGRSWGEVPKGLYRLEAVFCYSDLGGWPEPNQGILARSQSIPVEVGNKAPGEKRGVWKLLPGGRRD